MENSEQGQIEDHIFAHELNPQFRRDAAFDTERDRIRSEIYEKRIKSVSSIRKIVAVTLLLPVGILLIEPENRPFLSMIVLAVAALSPHLITLALLTRAITKARAQLHKWELIVRDCVEVERNSELRKRIID